MSIEEPGTVVEELGVDGKNLVQAPAGEKPKVDDDDLAQHVVDQGGRKLVPLEVVAEERRKKSGYRETADALQKQVDQLKPWMAFGQKAKPILEALQQRPELWEAIQTGKVPVSRTTEKDEANEELVSLAKALDLYDAHGQPDVGRAKTLDAWADRKAERKVDERVKPLAASTANDRSSVNLQRMSGLKTQEGKSVDPAVLQAMWKLVPAELSAQDEVAQVLLLAAAGYQNLFGKEPVKAEPVGEEPVYVEAAGGRSGPIRLTELQNKAAKDMGKTHAEFAKGIKDVMDKGGVLE